MKFNFFEVPDFHFSPEWSDVSESCAAAVESAAQALNPDLIALPGDLHEKPLYASDKDGYRKLLGIVSRWSKIAPVAAIEGTPSHDAPGAYAALEIAGVAILRPGKVYGVDGNVVEIKPDNYNSLGSFKAVLFGVPELNKKNIQAQLSLSADEANAAAVELFYRYVDEFVSPICSAVSCAKVMLFHGNMSDARQENTNDVILKASDIVVHTERLVHSGLDRVSMGHIHTPWESTVICGGYAGYPGIDRNPWGKRDFVPAFNNVTIEDGKVSIERIPYGTPERRKIFAPLQEYDKSVAYWLESNEIEAAVPDGHPWSRVTTKENRTETRRVTAEEAENFKGLVDLFKAIDPGVKESVMKKVSEIAETFKKEGAKPLDISLDKVEVKGCIFFKKSSGKDVVSADYSSFPVGLTALLGDNGDGKSSLLSFSSPYPVVIGKDTKSGRPSAIKDFFSGQDSYIEKWLTVNGSKHHHKITIRGAHTKSQKVECYIDVDGTPQLETGTFDDMMNMCENLYGSLSDFMMTYFYVQPLQGSFSSSLMSAKMSEIRNLVQTIANIDRSAELRHALDKKAEFGDKISKATARIEAAQEFAGDIESVQAEISEIDKELPSLKERIEKIVSSGKNLRSEVDRLAAAVEGNKEARRRNGEAAEKSINAHTAYLNAVEDVDSIKKEIESLSSMSDKTEKLARLRWLESEEDDISSRNRKERKDYEQKLDEFEEAEKGLKARVSDLSSRITAANNSLSGIGEPCYHCGKRHPDAEKLKAETEQLISELSGNIETATSELSTFQKGRPEEPEAKKFEKSEELNRLKDEFRFVDMSKLSEASNLLAAAKARLEIAVKSASEKEVADAEAAEYKSFPVDEEAESAFRVKTSELDAKRSEHSSAVAEANGLLERRKAKEQQIEGIKAKFAEIEKMKADKSNDEETLSDWTYIAAMLQPAKIPALELDLIADDIDAKANRYIEPYEDGKYSIRTVTQEEGRSGAVDRFDILIRDKSNGFEDSFIRHSPGEKAFFNDAYVKALVEIRNSRNLINYSPIIFDEADSPIQPKWIPSYYTIQDMCYSDRKVITVSHTPEAHNFIQNHVNVRELMHE